MLGKQRSVGSDYDIRMGRRRHAPCAVFQCVMLAGGLRSISNMMKHCHVCMLRCLRLMLGSSDRWRLILIFKLNPADSPSVPIASLKVVKTLPWTTSFTAQIVNGHLFATIGKGVGVFLPEPDSAEPRTTLDATTKTTAWPICHFKLGANLDTRLFDDAHSRPRHVAVGSQSVSQTVARRSAA